MIISNATPLIAFARIRQLSLLEKVVGNILIPQAVANEIMTHTTSPYSGIIDISQEAWIQIRPIRSEKQVQLLLPTLDRGEAEVIALALECRATAVLIDELTGRKVAESLGLSVSGSVGMLIRAKQMGEISVVKPYLDEMVRRGIRYSQRFINAILQQIGE